MPRKVSDEQKRFWRDLVERQEMLVGPLGLWLSRPLLWKLLAGTARCLKPLALLLREEILKGFVVQADETPVRFLGEEPGKSSLGYLFGYAGDAEHRFLIYDFQPNRSRAGPRELLADFRGVLQTDGYVGAFCYAVVPSFQVDASEKAEPGR